MWFDLLLVVRCVGGCGLDYAGQAITCSCNRVRDQEMGQ